MILCWLPGLEERVGERSLEERGWGAKALGRGLEEREWEMVEVSAMG